MIPREANTQEETLAQSKATVSLNEDVLQQIFEEAFRLKAAYDARQARRWLVESGLFQSRATLPLARKLLYSAIVLDTAHNITALTKTLRLYPYLAELCVDLVVCPAMRVNTRSNGTCTLNFKHNGPDTRGVSSASPGDIDGRWFVLDPKTGRHIKKRPPQAEDLPIYALAELFQCLSCLKFLNTGGFTWSTLMHALKTANFRKTLKNLYLSEIHLVQSNLPIVSLASADFLPSLQLLDITEMNPSYQPVDNQPAPASTLESNFLPDNDLHSPRSKSTLDEQAYEATWRTLSLQRHFWASENYVTWTIPNASADLAVVGDRLRKLDLTVPASYCGIVHRSMSRVLPHITSMYLGLQGVTLIAAESWYPGLVQILRATQVLGSFRLSSEVLPPEVSAAFPSSLNRLELEGCIAEQVSPTGSSFDLDALNTCVRKKSWLPDLKHLVYEPDASSLTMDLRQSVFHEEMDNLGLVLMEAEPYLADLERLRTCCSERSIELECEVLEDLVDWVKRGQDAYSDMLQREREFEDNFDLYGDPDELAEYEEYEDMCAYA